MMSIRKSGKSTGKTRAAERWADGCFTAGRLWVKNAAAPFIICCKNDPFYAFFLPVIFWHAQPATENNRQKERSAFYLISTTVPFLNALSSQIVFASIQYT